MQNEIISYFKSQVYIDIASEYFAPRIEPNYDNPLTKPSNYALMVHGVDFLDTHQVGNIFTIIG